MSETRAHGDDAVAVIGAGVAGLSCAVALSRALPEREIHIFDQGSRGRGGRTSSSRPSAHDDPLVFDHGCQFFTASDPEFKAVCASLVRSGHASRWDGRFGTLDARTGAFASRDDARGDVPPDDDFFGLLSADEVFVGVPTMRGLCDGLRKLIHEDAAVDSPQCAVTCLERARDETKNARPWVVSGVGGRALDENQHGSREYALGAFEAVIATDVMLTKTGTPGSCALEGVAEVSDEEAPRPEDVSGASARAAATWRAMRDSPAESLFSLMVAFGGSDEDEDASVPFDAVVVTGSETLQLLVRDSAKPGRAERGARNRWTAVSTAAFAAAVVADAPLSVDGAYNPQTAAYLERVTPAMVEATRDLLCAASHEHSKGATKMGDAKNASPTDRDRYCDPPTHAQSQRWGHAFPKRGWGGAGFAWDPSLRFGACGDFAAGSGVEAAWTSGAQAGAAVARTMRGEGGG